MFKRKDTVENNDAKITPLSYFIGVLNPIDNKLSMDLTFYDMNGNKSTDTIIASREQPDGYDTTDMYSLQYKFTPSGPCTCGAIVKDNNNGITLMKPRSQVCQCKMDGTLAMSISLPSELHPYNSSTILITLKAVDDNTTRFIIDLACSCATMEQDEGFQNQKIVLLKTSRDSGFTFNLENKETLGIIYVLYMVENHDINVFGGDDYIYPAIFINKTPYEDPNFPDGLAFTVKNSIEYEGNFYTLSLNGWNKVCCGLYCTQEQTTTVSIEDGAILIP